MSVPDQDNACVGKEDFIMKKDKNRTYKLVMAALMVAIATVLNEFAKFDSPFLMGGGVTVFSQVPIISMGYIFGPGWGLATGFTFSLLQIIFGLSNFSYVKGIGAYIILALFDYVVPYTLLGLGGIFKGKFKNMSLELTVGTLMVCVIRFLCHFLTGVTIWGQWSEGKAAKEVFSYSLSYNAGYMIPETIITLIGILALGKFVFTKLDSNGMLKTKS